ncbi:MAG TPA: DUF4193 domain-containing protein [Arthrobacter sp.]
MATDYDAPRTPSEEETAGALDGLAPEKGATRGGLVDLDDADLADTFELPGADLSSVELLVEIIPVQPDEFTCSSCFLVHHRSQLAREKDGRKYCTECES